MVSKQKIYLETSVISAYFDFWKTAPEQKKETRQFWKLVSKDYHLYISNTVIAELIRSHEQIRGKFINLTQQAQKLDINEQTMKLVEKYVKAGIVPETKRADATHIAIATLNKMDYIASWNNRHITRPFKRKQITDFNNKNNLPMPLILTPTDFLNKF